MVSSLLRFNHTIVKMSNQIISSAFKPLPTNGDKSSIKNDSSSVDIVGSRFIAWHRSLSSWFPACEIDD